MTFEEFLESQKDVTPPTAFEMKKIHAQIKIRDFIWNTLAFSLNHTIGYAFYALNGFQKTNIIPYKNTILPLNLKQILDNISSVHGYQLFIMGMFNGDPHPGNILLLDDGRIGLIDYGQVKHFDLDKRILLAKLMVHMVNKDSNKIVETVRAMGLVTKNNDPWVFEKTGYFYFDSDDLSVTEGKNFLQFMEYLNNRDPAVVKADDYVFPGRLRMIMSGLYYSLGYTFHGTIHWSKWYNKLLNDNNVIM